MHKVFLTYWLAIPNIQSLILKIGAKPKGCCGFSLMLTGSRDEKFRHGRKVGRERVNR
jgi:hypothetical protein